MRASPTSPSDSWQAHVRMAHVMIPSRRIVHSNIPRTLGVISCAYDKLRICVQDINDNRGLEGVYLSPIPLGA